MSLGKIARIFAAGLLASSALGASIPRNAQLQQRDDGQPRLRTKNIRAGASGAEAQLEAPEAVEKDNIVVAIVAMVDGGSAYRTAVQSSPADDISRSAFVSEQWNKAEENMKAEFYSKLENVDKIEAYITWPLNGLFWTSEGKEIRDPRQSYIEPKYGMYLGRARNSLTKELKKVAGGAPVEVSIVQDILSLGKTAVVKPAARKQVQFQGEGRVEEEEPEEKYTEEELTNMILYGNKNGPRK